EELWKAYLVWLEKQGIRGLDGVENGWTIDFWSQKLTELVKNEIMQIFKSGPLPGKGPARKWNQRHSLALPKKLTSLE
ncbi:unnamed protein product, partial [Amoebophrya sp. A120]